MVSTTLTTIAAGQLTSSSNHNQSTVTLASSTANNSNYQRSTQHQQQQQQQQQLQHHLSSSTTIGAATPITSHTAATTTTRNNYYYDLTSTTLNGEVSSNSNSDIKTFNATYKTAATSSVGGAVEINHNQKHNHNLNPYPQQHKRPTNSLYNGKAIAAQPNDYGSNNNTTGSNNSSSYAINHPTVVVVGETTKPDLLTSNIKSPQNDVINTTTTTTITSATTTTPTINLTKSLLSASPPLTDQISILFPKCRPKQSTAIANNIPSSNAISDGSDAIDVVGIECKSATFNGTNNSPTDIVEFNATAETLSATQTETENSEKTSRPRSSGSYYKTVNIITQSPPPPSTSSVSSESLSSVTPRISTNPFLCPTLLTTSSINSDTPLTTVASHNLNEVDDDEDDGQDENIDEELPVPAYPTFYYHTSSNHYNSNTSNSDRQRVAEIEGRKFFTSTNSYEMPRKARSSFTSYQQQQQHQQHQQAAAIQRQQYTKLSQATMTQQQQQQQHIGNHHPQQLHNGTAATGSDSGTTSMQQQHQHHLANNQSQNQSQNPFIKSNYWETRQSVTTAAANAVLNSPEYGGNEIELPSAVAAPPLASSRRAYHQQSYNSQTHQYMLRQQHHIRVGRSPVNHSEQQTQQQQQLEMTSKRIGNDHQLNKPQPQQQQQHHHQNADINHYSQSYGNSGSNNSKTSIEQHVAVMDREQYERREREGRERDREQREHRLNVAAAVVERDRERDNERERIRETAAGICDVGPLQQSSGNKAQQQQQQQQQTQHMSHQKNIGINNDARLSVIADGEVVVFDDIAESWQNLRVTTDPNAATLPTLSPTTSPTQKILATTPTQQQAALTLCGQKDEILEMYHCENEPTSYREHKRYLDGNNYAITVETRHGIIEYEGSPRRIGKCGGTNATDDENAQVVGQQTSKSSYNVAAASSVASNSPQQYPARPGFPQRIISPPRESTPPMLLYNHHNNFKQQQQLQQQQQQSLQYPSPTDNNAEDTSNDVSEIGTLSDMTTPEVTSTTAAAAPPPATVVAESTITANTVPTALATTSTAATTTSYTVNAIGNSSAVGLSLPAKSSTFDYLYEFSETRKVLEEFFKCPSSDEKPIENSSDVDSVDIQYEFHGNLDRDDDEEDEEPEEDDDDEQLQQQLQQQQQQLQQQKQIQQQQQQQQLQQQQQFQQSQNNYNVNNQRRHYTSSPLMRDFDFFLDSASRSSGEPIDQQDGINHNQLLDARNNYRYSPETTDYDSNCGDLDSLSGELNGISTSCSNYAKYYASSMPVLEDGLSSGHTSDTENNNHNNINNNLQQISTVQHTPIGGGISMLMDMKRISTNNSINGMNNATITPTTTNTNESNSIDKCSSSISPNMLHDSYLRKNESPLSGLLEESGHDSVRSKRELLGQSPSNNSNSKVFKNIDPDLDSLYSISVFQRPDMTQMTPPPPAPAPHRKPNQSNQQLQQQQQQQQQIANTDHEILQPVPYKDLRSSNTNTTTSSTTTATSSVASAISSTLNRTKATPNNTATTPLQVLPTAAVRTHQNQPQPPPVPERAAPNPQPSSPVMKSPVWVPRHLDTSASKSLLESPTEHLTKNMSADEDDVDTDLETDRLLGHQRLDDQGYYDENKSWDRKPRSLLSKISPKQQHTSTKTRNGYNALLSSTPEIPPPVPPKNSTKKLLTIGNSSLSSPEHSDKSPEKSLEVEECVVAMGSPGGSLGSGCGSHKKDHTSNSNAITSSSNNNNSSGGGAQNNGTNGTNSNSNSAGSNSTTGEKKVKKSKNKEGGAVLIEGVLFRARYLGSTQLVCEGQPTKSTRMMQAEEAVSRIKAPDGDVQPSTEVDLFISTEKIMVLNTDLKEIMMDHALRTISYIADIGDLVVLMARRRFVPQDIDDAPKPNRTPKMICHVFESDEAQFIAQSIGQAFQVAYMEFLKANGIEDHSFVKEMDYQEVLNSQEIFGDELEIFAKKELQKEVVVPKAKGEILGVVIVESGWGSMLPTVVIANLMSTGAAARCGQLNIGDQLIAINGLSLVGLPLSTCQTYIKNTKNQTVVKFTVVPCAPVVEVKIKRPNTKYQLGFSVQNGVICSLLRGGIAERGGVRVGHRIIEINNQSVVAVPHEKIVNLLATSVGEILMKTMPTSMFRLLTGQENPIYI